MSSFSEGGDVKRVAIGLVLSLLLGAVAFAGPYFDLEQFIEPPGILGDFVATFGFDFVEFVGDSGFIVSGDLFYADDSLWLWSAPGKDSAAGLSLSLMTPWAEDGVLPDRWVFDIDAVIDLHSRVPNHWFRPEASEVMFTLTAVLGNWELFARATSVLDYDPYLWNLLPSFGLSSRY